MKSNHASSAKPSSEDLHLIETIAAHYAPAAMSPQRRAAFRQRLDERLEKRLRRPWRLGLAAATCAALAATLWLVLPTGSTPTSNPAVEVAQVESAGLYPYVDPELYDASWRASSSWPGEYQELALAVGLTTDR